MIPDAALDAARLAVYKARWVDAFGPNGVIATDEVIARAALEAAAPHMREVQWGVRDKSSLHIAGHPSEESARGTVAVRPEWYEVVSRPTPGLWTTP